jgi:hypothetical protein
MKVQQPQPHRDLAGHQRTAMGDLVGGHGRRGGAVGSGAPQQAMHNIQDGERQPADRRRPQPLARRSIRIGSGHQGIIQQLTAAMRWIA